MAEGEGTTNNLHLLLLRQFYVKRNAADVALCAKAKLKASKTVTAVTTASQQQQKIEYDWRYEGHKTVFDISLARKDELTGEDVSILDNVSFIHSILYLVDLSQHYAAGLTAHKRADCLEVIELVRRHLSKGKVGKEAARSMQNLADHVYADATIQSIVDYFGSFHLIVLSNNVAEAPKLFPVGTAVGGYHAAGAVVVVYFDEQKEMYYPLACVNWTEKNFMAFLKGVYLWNKPVDTKKWAVADLRAYILFFDMPIDTTLDKKAILAQFVL
jgi:hypothetical protein